MSIITVLPPVLAFYPLNLSTKGRDISPNKNPKGRITNARYQRGPSNEPGGSILLKGQFNSYVEFPKKKRNPADEITVLAYILPGDREGPIIANGKKGGVGIKFYTTKKGLSVSFSSPKKTLRVVYPKMLSKPKWKFVGASYSRKTRLVKIFIDSKEYARKKINRFRVPLDYTMRVGAVRRDPRRLRGKVACIQIYPEALTPLQIRMARRLCSKTGR